MNPNFLNRIKIEFSESDQSIAIESLSSISLDNAMAKSQENLESTIAAIINLSAGDLSKLMELIACAKLDFRDVIYWDQINPSKRRI